MPDKTDNRPSDTKSVVLNRTTDKPILDHLASLPRGYSESEFWRAAAYFYLDFMAWIAAQPDAPAPDQAFVYYRAWLEARPAGPVAIDPASIAAAVLPGVRDIIEAALAGASLPPSPAGRGVGGEVELELADLFAGELVLE